MGAKPTAGALRGSAVTIEQASVAVIAGVWYLLR